MDLVPQQNAKLKTLKSGAAHLLIPDAEECVYFMRCGKSRSKDIYGLGPLLKHATAPVRLLLAHSYRRPTAASRSHRPSSRVKRVPATSTGHRPAVGRPRKGRCRSRLLVGASPPCRWLWRESDLASGTVDGSKLCSAADQRKPGHVYQQRWPMTSPRRQCSLTNM